METFLDDVDLAGGRASVHVYPGAGHVSSAFGFSNYDAKADVDSWARPKVFLDDLAG